MAAEKTEAHKGKVIYFSHGGGSLPIRGDNSHKAMIASGFSFHSMGAYLWYENHTTAPPHAFFRIGWLNHPQPQCHTKNVSGD